MDCLFNKSIPKSTSNKVILEPTSRTFVTGLAGSYDESYPKELSGRISLADWTSSMARINEELFFNWPCLMCMSFGYCFCICTLGLSLCIPGLRARKAKKGVSVIIREINEKYSAKGVYLSLVQSCCTSWIEVSISEQIPLELDNSSL